MPHWEEWTVIDPPFTAPAGEFFTIPDSTVRDSTVRAKGCHIADLTDALAAARAEHPDARLVRNQFGNNLAVIVDEPGGWRCVGSIELTFGRYLHNEDPLGERPAGA